MLRVKIVLIVLLLLVCIPSSAREIEVWLLGFNNEMIRIAQNMIDEEFSPKTGIDVYPVALPWGSGDRILLAIAAGDPPDLLTTGLAGAVEYGLRGAVMDLRKRYGAEFDAVEAQLFPALTQPLHWRGTRFGVPHNVSLMVGAYRTDLWEDLGAELPVTWQDVYKVLPRAQSRGMQVAFDYGSPDYAAVWGVWTLVSQHGGHFISEETFSSAFDRPESIRGFKEYTELYTKHKIPKAGPGLTPFRNGEWIMSVDGYWLLTQLQYSAPEIQGRWAPGLIPGVQRTDGVLNHGTFTGATTFAIPNQAKDPDGAWEFIKWFCSADVQKRYVERIVAELPGSLLIPASMEALMNLENVDERSRKIMHEQILQSTPISFAPSSGALWRFVEFAAHEVLMGIHTPEEAVRRATSQMNAEMARRQVEYRRFLERL